MSAFIVPDAHLNFLLTFAHTQRATIYTSGRAYDCRFDESLQALADKLREANYASVNYRYQETDTAPQTAFRFHSAALSGADPLMVLKACACYEYQSCEPPDWPQSEAAQIISAIRSYAIRRLPGWDTMRAWPIEEEGGQVCAIR